MDPQTSRHYSSRVQDTTSLYNSMKSGGVSAFFSMSFSPGSRILDIGAGSGRDFGILLSAGYDAWGIDASADMVTRGNEDFPALAGRYTAGSIPSSEVFFGGGFDGILCSAVLQHLEDELLLDAAFTIRNNLNSGGRLLLSVPHTRPDAGEDGRLPDGRLFVIRPSAQYDLLFERLGFIKVHHAEREDGLGREGVRWDIMIYRLEATGPVRSIDRIESIINREQKTATYKFALLRALAEIAQTEYNTARWRNDGYVGIPLKRIAEKWLYYYWPLFENAEFIPQIHGEKPGCKMPVKFRGELNALINKYRPLCGLDTFHAEYIRETSGQIPAGPADNVLKSITDTIVKGPAYYTKGSGEERLFSVEKNRLLLVPADIWKELCLLGHWIGDALILRWGELTSRMSDEKIPASKVIDCLLRIPLEKRDVTESSRIFSEMPDLECVWTGTRLNPGMLNIDHVIPFVLWHNNDLWNLLPAHAKVNNAKRDKLPSGNLLRTRRDAITGYWEQVHGLMSRRFTLEACRLMGKDPGGNWQAPLFAALYDAVEITAIQRGVERWEG